MKKIVKIILIIACIILLINLVYLNIKIFEMEKIMWGNRMPKDYKPKISNIIQRIGLIRRVDSIDDLESRIDDLETRAEKLESGIEVL